MTKVTNFDQSIIGQFRIGLQCECCKVRSRSVIRDHQRTMYHHEGEIGDANDPNMVTLCPDCESQWDEYYSGCL